MLKGLLGILLFIFFLIVFIVMLTWGYILRTIHRLREQARKAAEQQDAAYRSETGRQRTQYSHRQQTADGSARQQQSGYQGAQTGYQGAQTGPQGTQTSQPRSTQTATGETIIDHRHQERTEKKIFDDSDGEYVDFTEEY